MTTYLKSIIRHILIWTPVFIAWTIVRESGRVATGEFDAIGSLTFLQHVIFHFVIGIVAGMSFGTMDYFFEKYILRRFSFGKTIILGTIGYLIAIVTMVSIGTVFVSFLTNQQWSLTLLIRFMLSADMVLLIFYCMVIGFAIGFVKEVDMKFGPGNLWKMLKGEFYYPKEDNRIFMFLDLKSSTTIAERLGHQKYSELIQSCFHEVSDLVFRYRARVYQYVGDEIVLSWSIEDGLYQQNCLRFFYTYRDKLNSKKDYYESNFGQVPQFKAGIEMGVVMVAEVGDIKREIAYHGDVLNTAARIQGRCNEFGQEVLVSENVMSRLNDTVEGCFNFVGDIQLRGKTKNLKIYSVNESALRSERIIEYFG